MSTSARESRGLRRVCRNVKSDVLVGANLDVYALQAAALIGGVYTYYSPNWTLTVVLGAIVLASCEMLRNRHSRDVIHEELSALRADLNRFYDEVIDENLSGIRDRLIARPSSRPRFPLGDGPDAPKS